MNSLGDSDWHKAIVIANLAATLAMQLQRPFILTHLMQRVSQTLTDDGNSFVIF